MSYTLIYARQFVKTHRGIIPLVLAGDNNTGMYVGNREIAGREWEPAFASNGKVEMSEAEILAEAARRFGSEALETDICLKITGKWAKGKDAYRYFAGGIQNALTLEEIRRLSPFTNLNGCVSYYAKRSPSESASYFTERVAVLASTEELEAWLDAAESRLAELKCNDIKAHLELGFNGYKPLGIEKAARSRKITGPVIAKYAGRYVTAYDAHGITTTLDNGGGEKAVVFDSVAEAEAKLPSRYEFVFQSAASVKPANFVVRVSEGTRTGGYVRKKTRRYLFLGTVENAKRFHSESEARRWCDKHLFITPDVSAYQIIDLRKENS